MRQRGFTLIELLVVVVIIGLLAATAMPKYFHGICMGKQGATIEQLGALGTAVMMYYADSEELPTGDCVPFSSTPAGQDPYMAEVPETPWDGLYKYKAEGGAFVIVAQAEGGKGCDGETGSSEGDDYFIYMGDSFRVIHSNDDHGCF